MPERIFRNKSYLLMVAVLLVPVLPFAVFGWWLEPQAANWTSTAKSPTTMALLVVGLLATDILLPIPSSVISTLAGNRLGLWGGAACSWVGMSASAAIGFGLARWISTRWISAKERESVASNDFDGSAVGLAACRGLPVLAEASVLHCGLRQMPPTKFWPPVLLSNLGISFAYAWLGETTNSMPALAIVLGLVACVPLLISVAVRRIGKRK